MNNRVSNELLSTISGYENRKIYETPFINQPKGTMVESDSENLKEQVRRTKVVESLKVAIEKCEIKDGMTISFHHHFRAGDKLLMMVVDTLAEI